ncbi:MAG TPA: VOC family protein [Dehalococcoidia bacterium]|nr:VOC family protein [Dehalococcoidia bacterium]
MPITDWDHYTLRTRDIEASWRFYEKGLGLDVRKREGFPIPAFIVSIGTREVVHGFLASEDLEKVFARMAPKDEETAKWPTGRIQHVEFWATGLNEMKANFDREGIAWTERSLPDKHQVGVHDPDGIEVNINYPLSEVGK